MRLQGAIFEVPGTLLEDGGTPRPGVEQFLALMKMDGVWMYAVTEGPTTEARQVLEQAGLAPFFRGVLSAKEQGCAPGSPVLYEKALRRLRTHPLATLAVTARPEALTGLKEAGFPTALVSPDPTEEQRALANEIITDYRDMTR